MNNLTKDNGVDFEKNFDEIRKKVGLCTQKDILYPDLTPEEHLELIGRLRGLDSDTLDNEVKKVIRKV